MCKDGPRAYRHCTNSVSRPRAYTLPSAQVAACPPNSQRTRNGSSGEFQTRAPRPGLLKTWPADPSLWYTRAFHLHKALTSPCAAHAQIGPTNATEAAARARWSPASAHATSSRAKIVHSMQLSCFTGTMLFSLPHYSHTRVSKAGWLPDIRPCWHPCIA